MCASCVYVLLKKTLVDLQDRPFHTLVQLLDKEHPITVMTIFHDYHIQVVRDKDNHTSLVLNLLVQIKFEIVG